MITPSILDDSKFKKKLSSVKSPQLDAMIDEMLESTDEAFLSQCDQHPKPDQMNSLNIARLSVKALLTKLKSSNLELTEE